LKGGENEYWTEGRNIDRKNGRRGYWKGAIMKGERGMLDEKEEILTGKTEGRDIGRER
jgi:hypothetical protein